VKNQNIVSVSWGDHLLFGEGDGKLDTPNALKKRMLNWNQNLGATSIHWRQVRTVLDGHFFAAPGRVHPYEKPLSRIEWNDFEVVPEVAHSHNMMANLYVTLFDEGWRLAPQKERESSYHNSMHCQHVSWQSSFSYEHPEYTVIDKTGKKQWGVLCLAYPEVREHFCKHFINLLNGYNWDGLFVCFRSQSKPPEFADQYNYNEPVRNDFLKKYEVDILKENFDFQDWHNMLGGYITLFMEQLRGKLKPLDVKLSVGVARGDVIGPPLGNATLQWRKWIEDGLVDELIINQNSSQCPSMWHQLWPMHRGTGYKQNYLNPNMTQLKEQLDIDYLPVISKNNKKLFIARQWDERSEQIESQLKKHQAVSGLVFSSFRHDNPNALSRNNWIA